MPLRTADWSETARRLLARGLEAGVASTRPQVRGQCAPGRGSAVRLQVHGHCMRPALQDLDWAWIEPLHAPPKTGEIVLARTDRDELVCHRVLGCTPQGILAAGDRSLEVLEHTAEDVFGRLVAIERNGERRPFRRRAIDGLLARLHLLTRTFRSRTARRVLNLFRHQLARTAHAA